MPITPHEARTDCIHRVDALGVASTVPLELDLFRFISPRYAKAADVVSGKGALNAAGRWHSSGTIRLSYTALSPETALAENFSSARYYHLPLSKALPRVLVALHLKATRVLDLRTEATVKALALDSSAMLLSDWRQENQAGREAFTQAWGLAFAKAGLEAVVVPSAAHLNGANALVFPENLLPGSVFAVLSEVRWPGTESKEPAKLQE